MTGDDRNKNSATDIVQGIITASEWDDAGNVVGVKLLTFDEDEYAISNGESCFDYIKQTVHITGWVQKDPWGRKTIKIVDCRVLRPFQY